MVPKAANVNMRMIKIGNIREISVLFQAINFLITSPANSATIVWCKISCFKKSLLNVHMCVCIGQYSVDLVKKKE